MTVNFEKLPINGGKPEEISKVVNLLVDGKINSTGTFTLQQSSTTTVVSDLRAGENSIILFTPTTSNGASALATTFLSSRGKEQFTITHQNNSQTDRTFLYAIFG